jgi:hypothetical protein
MRYVKINPFSVVSKEEIQQADEQKAGKHAITKNAHMEETDLEISTPMSSADVKELWRDWREAKRAKKEALLKGK